MGGIAFIIPITTLQRKDFGIFYQNEPFVFHDVAAAIDWSYQWFDTFSSFSRYPFETSTYYNYYYMLYLFVEAINRIVLGIVVLISFARLDQRTKPQSN